MDDSILIKRGANFYGFESIDLTGQHHCHPYVVRGYGDLFLSRREIVFKQWITQEEYIIPFYKVIEIEIKTWHNMKMKWPGKVLRVFFRDGNETKKIGIALGGKLNFTKGWQDDGYKWKEKIESMLDKKF